MNYLFLEAFTNSEWDSVSVGLVPANKQFFKDLLEKVELLDNPLLKDVDYLAVSSGMVDYFLDSVEDIELIANKELTLKTVIELEDSVIEEISRPEQFVECGLAKIGRSGVTFVSFGKHTGEEYWCEANLALIKSLAV